MNKSPLADKETILAAVRAAVRDAGGQRIGIDTFLGLSGIKRRDIFKHYDQWNEVLRAAGFDFGAYNPRLDDSVLFADWAAVIRKLKHVPSRVEYEKNGKFSSSVILRRIGSWRRIPYAFRAVAAHRSQWNDIFPLIPTDIPAPVAAKPRCKAGSPRRMRKPAPLPNGRPLFGEPLGIGGMLNTPLNEQGVVFLFAILAADLGFHVESLQTGFPDCEARRQIRPGMWQSARIEFEYESRNFRIHGHPFNGCDFIVCWTHNWPDCPKNIEVIELSEEVKRLTICKIGDPVPALRN